LEDIRAVIDYLTTLPYVDSGKIEAMGTCTRAEVIQANAAINDRRINTL
jgi:dienelactone hydrolase